MADSLIPHLAPTFDEPIDMLNACHGRVLAQLDTLRRLVPHLAQNGSDVQAQQAAGAIMRYFDTAARHHHDDEEVDLLPALMAGAMPLVVPEVQAVRERILAEHARMYALWAALRPQLNDIRLGAGRTLDEALVAELDELYRAHIDFEEDQLLPLARRILDETKLLPIGAAMTARRTTGSGAPG
ncbi:MAG TPA: hemerythrin domain-containing protein [Rhodocyclaceae bacterium]|nr:hemerythrin domain-containing protein [Rhodocyclaceae bacterium]HMV53561.1 hemerythrin domain-containing protein [Rhodocyclaceae bacterium]HNA02614.1 hemerythrin domain-containing protein [Rhodocyclaceae bacterium]HNB77119.1 hemerythrin domain-containing protein [Rhodocyclaceae bacterium]HNC62472.1 hemerythrin domain-containing protein [Rhodocyclaceae bacterium]